MPSMIVVGPAIIVAPERPKVISSPSVFSCQSVCSENRTESASSALDRIWTAKGRPTSIDCADALSRWSAIIMIGGIRLIDVNDETVNPTGPASDPNVAIATPLARRLIALLIDSSEGSRGCIDRSLIVAREDLIVKRYAKLVLVSSKVATSMPPGYTCHDRNDHATNLQDHDLRRSNAMDDAVPSRRRYAGN